MPGHLAIALIIKGLLLGLGAAVPIGPVNVEIARRTLRQGFRFGAAIGAGAVTVDVTYAIVASIGWAPLMGNRAITYTLGSAGVVLLVYLSSLCFRGLYRAARARGTAVEDDPFAIPSTEPAGAGSPQAAHIPAASARNAVLDYQPRAATRDELETGPGLRATYVTGLLMTFFNPMTLAFWFVVLPGIAAKLTDHPRHDLPFLCFGVFLGAFGWAVRFSAVLSVLGRFRRNLWVMAADAVGGVVLLGFALLAASRLLLPLLGR